MRNREQPDEPERDAPETGGEEGPSRRRNTPSRPRGRSGRQEHGDARSLDAPEGVVDQRTGGLHGLSCSCSGYNGCGLGASSSEE